MKRSSAARARIRAALEAAQARSKELGVRVLRVDVRVSDARLVLEDAEKLAAILDRLERQVRELEAGERRRRRA